MEVVVEKGKLIQDTSKQLTMANRLIIFKWNSNFNKRIALEMQKKTCLALNESEVNFDGKLKFVCRVYCKT